MDKKTNDVLQKLITEVTQQTAYTQFIEAKEKINNKEITTLIEDIERTQKNSVHLNHYEKKQAFMQNEEKVDQLYQQLETNPIVQEYRECLMEANDLLQYITGYIEEKINEEDDHV